MRERRRDLGPAVRLHHLGERYGALGCLPVVVDLKQLAVEPKARGVPAVADDARYNITANPSDWRYTKAALNADLAAHKSLNPAAWPEELAPMTTSQR